MYNKLLVGSGLFLLILNDSLLKNYFRRGFRVMRKILKGVELKEEVRVRDEI